MSLATRIMTLAELTLQDPRRATRALLALGLPLPARTLGLLLVAVVSALVMSIQIGFGAGQVDPMIAILTASPFRAALLQWLALALSALMVHGIGRACGGKGNLPDAILITVWLQFLLLGLQVFQLVAGLVSPALAGMIGLASLALFLWLLTAFVTELHGFRSRGVVFVGILASGLSAGLIIAFAIVLLVGPEVFLPHV